MNEVNRLFKFGLKVGVDFDYMQNHVKVSLLKMVSMDDPVSKKSYTLPNVIATIKKKFVVQTLWNKTSETQISLGEPKERTKPLVGFQDTFIIHIEYIIEENNCGFIDDSGTSTPTYPPGFEPVTIKELSDDASSHRKSNGVIPKRMLYEWKRLGATPTEVDNSSIKPRRIILGSTVNKWMCKSFHGTLDVYAQEKDVLLLKKGNPPS